jgi:hypothetical protein
MICASSRTLQRNAIATAPIVVTTLWQSLRPSCDAKLIVAGSEARARGCDDVFAGIRCGRTSRVCSYARDIVSVRRPRRPIRNLRKIPPCVPMKSSCTLWLWSRWPIGHHMVR